MKTKEERGEKAIKAIRGLICYHLVSMEYYIKELKITKEYYKNE